MRGIAARKPRAGIVKHRDTDGNVPDAHAVVDESSALPGGVPTVDVGRTHLEFKGRRHAVKRLKAVGFRRLAMGVEIDESRRHDEAGGVNRRPPGQSIGGDRNDLSAANPDVAHSIQTRLGIDHAAVRDDQVEGLCHERRLGADAKGNQRCRAQERCNSRSG